MFKNKLIVGYIRLSKEDIKNSSQEYSDSIENQINYVREFASTRSMNIDEYYIDDGFTGINYERPAYEKLKKDIENGKIKTVITKDVSRLGRELVDTVYYICRYFKEHNIRYIAINDNYDTHSNSSFVNDIMIKIKSIANDNYIKTTSKKISLVKKLKKEQGNYIGIIAPYGYIKYKQNGILTLKVDEKVKSNIIRIFTEIAGGYSRTEVAENFNKENILAPIEYLKMTKSKNKNYSCKWSSIIIYKIIRNKIYLGHTIIKSSKKSNYKQKKREYIPINIRELIEDTHEAIVSNDLFNKANNQLKTRKNIKNTYEGFFKNKVICNLCGNVMKCIKVIRTDGNGDIHYHYKCIKSIYNKKCLNRSISESILKEIVLKQIMEMIDKYIDKGVIISKAINSINEKNKLNIEIRNINCEIKQYNLSIKKLYIEKTNGVISLEDFIKKKKEESYIKNTNEKRLKYLIKKRDNLINKDNIIKLYTELINKDNISEYILENLIDKIIIFKEKKIEVKFKFNIISDKNSLFKNSQQMGIKTI